jgi:acyl transferase domain-containing protein/phosphopantetheinyl transferase (holo-ACP synthase)
MTMADGVDNFVAEGSAPACEPIAIIGMAGIFPQAPDVQTFWANIINGVDAVSEPVPQWEAERYLKSGRIKTPFGGYLKDLYRFDPREFGIMPNSVDGGEPDQFLALRVARDALVDAGYLRSDYDHRDTGIILGHSTYLHRGQGTLIQNHIVVDQTLDVLRAVCPHLDEDRLAEIRNLLASKLPPANVDIVPGFVPNVMTGRIANRLNLKGPNYLVDAACASSLLAVNAAIDELRSGRSRLMLAGGVNASLPAEVTVIFTQLGALSVRGKVRPFETGSDGTLLAEGLGVVALKRLSDAIADGDRVYAVIRGVGQASDGKGLGLLAPGIEGETLAIQRAYASCGVDPASISLVEAHGTGIPLGGQTEITALKTVFGERHSDGGHVAIGSVKSMIGHCIPAAGIASLIKSALALHHKVLPPTLCESIDPELGIDKTPFYVNTETAPWIGAPGVPRRAGINSFGFGGINAHAIVEEAPAVALRPKKLTPWPVELCIFSADTPAQLVEKLEQFAAAVKRNPGWHIAEIAAALAAADNGGPHRLAMVVKDTGSLGKNIDQALKRLRENASDRWATRGGAVYSSNPLDGKLAFLFPGEGSQYLGMFADLALYFDEVREWFDFWRGLYNEKAGTTRTDIVFPPASELTDTRREALEKRLHDMDVGSEAVFIGAQAMHAVLKSLEIEPDVMIGHSSGESSALAASGAIVTDGPRQLADFIRQLNAVYMRVLAEGKIPTGALLAVGALSHETVQQHIDAVDKTIVIAMDNCANQQVLYGSAESIEALEKTLTAAGGIVLPLPFNRGYHTPAFAEVSTAFHNYYKSIRLSRPRIPLYSCASTGLFPDNATAVRKLAAAQWSTTVRFRETLARMHDDGVRYFLEVGPSGSLTTFVNDILAGREYLALATNVRRRGGLDQVLSTLAHLYVNRRHVKLDRLFSPRSIAVIDLAGTAPATAKGVLLDNTMPVLRIDDNDRAALRELAAQANTASPASVPAAAPEPAAAAESVDDDQAPTAAENAVAGAGTETAQIETDGDFAAEAYAPAMDAALLDEYTSFLDAIVERDDQHLVAQCRLSLYYDNFLKDHVLSGPVSVRDPELSGLACVPFMVSLEIMAEACAALAGSVAIRAIENVKAFDWIALDDGELMLEVRAEVIDGARGVYSASLVNAQGATAVSAEFLFTPDWTLPPLPELTEYLPSRWNDGELYLTGMFHGPVFQSIRHIDGWDASGIDAQLSEVSLHGFFTDGRLPKLVLNPVLLDAMGQLAAYWIAQQVGTDFNCFPSTIDRIELYSECPADQPGLTLLARQESLDPSTDDVAAPRAWYFECIDAQGQPLVRVSNLVNVYFPVPNRFYQVRRDPLNGWLGHPSPASPHGIMLWELPLLTEDFCAQSGNIFLRILAHVFLSFEEREEWRALSGSVRRRREWLLGRAALKEASRHWIFQQTGHLLYPSDIVVRHDEHGAPYVDGSWRDALIAAPAVSLSHNARACLAAVTGPQHAVGVDIEDIGRIQQPELMVESLTSHERAFVQDLNGVVLDERLLRLWCAKEAAAKYFGLGLQGEPAAFEVSFLDEKCAQARVDHGEATVEVSISRDGNSIIAVAGDQFRGTEVH